MAGAERRGASPSRQAAERAGRRAERIALLLLRLKFYRPLATRFKCPVGEIDLIVRRGRTVAFVEVKQRASLALAAEAVSPAARIRIVRAADFWLSRHPAASGLDFRFDAVLIGRGGLPRHMPAWFDADGF